jgi:hypothetical protein
LWRVSIVRQEEWENRAASRGLCCFHFNEKFRDEHRIEDAGGLDASAQQSDIAA